MTSLEKKLLELDGKGYGAYKSLVGTYEFPLYQLVIDHVQADPFAPPSNMHFLITQDQTGIPVSLLNSKAKLRAVADFLQRSFAAHIDENTTHHSGSGHSGEIRIENCGQEILDRTAVIFSKGLLEVRFEVGLPASGRRIRGKAASKIFGEALPNIVTKSLLYRNLDSRELKKQVTLFLEQQELRQQMQARKIVAFVGNGSILPRETGASDLPLAKAVPFSSPGSMREKFQLSDGRQVTGMGIKPGISLIVGGGYHGKSTLLRALAVGVYDHVPGDGRELVLTDRSAMKIRAEDGRSIKNVNINPFISHVPGRHDTSSFSTANASGSTSQAANVIEALESGSKLLLIDEDTSATNFMIRDGRMQRLVTKAHEPITPFVDKVAALYNQLGVSTILVTGGSGDYFEVADRVIMMDEYQPGDVTERARQIAALEGYQRSEADKVNFGQIDVRMPQKDNFKAASRRERFKVRNKNKISFGHVDVDLSGLEQLVETGQTRGIVALLQVLRDKYMNGRQTIADITDKLYDDIDQNGLALVLAGKQHRGDLALPRRQELCAALNRYRGLHVAKRQIRQAK